MNWIDILAVLPYYLQIITEIALSLHETTDGHVRLHEEVHNSSKNILDISKAKVFDFKNTLQAFRIMRIIRVLKLGRHLGLGGFKNLSIFSFFLLIYFIPISKE